MNEEFNNHRMDIELEARIVALVLGEASEQDREQLSRLIEERPELAAFKSEIEAAHGLVSRVGTTEWPASENDWKLSPEKRGSILAVIRGGSSQSITPSDNKPAIFQLLAKDKARWSLLRIAAAVCGAGVFGLLAMAILLFNRGARMAQSNTNGRSWHCRADIPGALVVGLVFRPCPLRVDDALHDLIPLEAVTRRCLASRSDPANRLGHQGSILHL